MSYSTKWLPGQGLHPKLVIDVDAPITAPCPLYAVISLPAAFIADRFQLGQMHLEGRLGAPDDMSTSTTLQVLGERDLEQPVSRAGNASVLVRIRHAVPSSIKGKEREVEEYERISMEVPLHLRYQRPVARRWANGHRQDQVEANLPQPALFWACRDADAKAATRLGQSCPPSSVPVPFDALSSFDALHYLRLGNSTQSHACPPHHLVPPLSLSVPTGVLADLPVVETITFLAIWTGMLWVCRVAFKTRLPSNCKYEKEDAGNAKEGKSNQESREKTRKKQ